MQYPKICRSLPLYCLPVVDDGAHVKSTGASRLLEVIGGAMCGGGTYCTL
jgi:hypothetical protein